VTNKKFKALPRYLDGSIINLYAVFHELTPKQVDRLAGDDWSRYADYQEEVRCMVADLRSEYGI
jgi:hypothetical protein